MNALLDQPLNIKVKISKSRVVEADLYKELSIDVSSIKQEILNQPAKFATWATLSDLAEQRRDKLKYLLSEGSVNESHYSQLVEKLSLAEKHYEFFSSIKDMFSYRMTILVFLMGNNYHTRVPDEYENAVYHLRVLMKDIVPYLSPQY